MNTKNTMNELCAAATAPDATADTIRLALSIAYQLGRDDANRDSLVRDINDYRSTRARSGLARLKV